jgi:hypothetical protein
MVGIVLITLAMAHGAYGQDPEPRLELEQVAEVVLPVGFNVTGGLLTHASGAIVWGPGGLLRVDAGKEAQLLLSGDLVQIRGVQVVGDHPPRYVVMGAEGGLFDVGSDGILRSTASLEVEGEIVQAVPLGDQWLVHETSGQQGMPMVLRWRPTPGATTRGDPLVSSDGEWLPPFRLISSGGTAFIQEMGRPYGILRIEPHKPTPGVVKLLSGEAIQGTLMAHGFPRGNTAALPIVPLDDGYLLQFSDLESDRRLMVTLDSGFRLISSVVVPAPIGFMAAAHGPRQLLALVDTGVPEVRFYRWHWSGRSRHWPTPQRGVWR